MNKNKYNAVKTTVDNIKFDSKKEASRYLQLKMLQKIEKIAGLKLQPVFDLSVNGMKICSYRADFKYLDFETGETVIEDVKGVKTPVYNLKKKLMKALYDIDIFET